ncbi:hypothetical protein J1N35_012182 [Gossypium stocksii]|uniref:Uncharacterized protein n=1 Tax=Gossypium stocksii TaxID=47602 RepID=A0A9D3W3F0_9ROSI|nr:hypothetical protein J1N35_012182 [Gossypium stocksii]
MRTVGLGKTSKQWRREVRREKSKVVEGEKKLQDAQTQEVALRKSLLENQDEKEKLRARVTVLEKSLRHYRSRNSVVELKASLNRIEGLEKKIVELETVLQNSETRVEILEIEESRFGNLCIGRKQIEDNRFDNPCIGREQIEENRFDNLCIGREQIEDNRSAEKIGTTNLFSLNSYLLEVPVEEDRNYKSLLPELSSSQSSSGVG